MVEVEQWAELRRLHFAEDVPIRELTRRTGLGRNTSRRALRRQEPLGGGPGAPGDRQGLTAAWHTLESLEACYAAIRADGSVSKAIAKLIRADLTIIDDVGMVPGLPRGRRGALSRRRRRHEKRSLAITSNIHPSGFDELMPKTLVAATVDRLLHHAHVIVTERAESYRLAQATGGKGVVPLS